MGNILESVGKPNQHALAQSYAALIEAMNENNHTLNFMQKNLSDQIQGEQTRALQKDAIQAQNNANIANAWSEQYMMEMSALKEAKDAAGKPKYTEEQINEILNQRRNQFYKDHGYSTESNGDLFGIGSIIRAIKAKQNTPENIAKREAKAQEKAQNKAKKEEIAANKAASKEDKAFYKANAKERENIKDFYNQTFGEAPNQLAAQEAQSSSEKNFNDFVNDGRTGKTAYDKVMGDFSSVIKGSNIGESTPQSPISSNPLKQSPTQRD